MKRGGFTIVEVVIAIGIMILLLGMAIPRYNSFAQQQDFNASAENMVNCIRGAQQEAASPSAVTPFTKTVRYTGALLVWDVDYSRFHCYRSYYGTTNNDGSDITTANLVNGTASILTPDGSSAATLQLASGTVTDQVKKMSEVMNVPNFKVSKVTGHADPLKQMVDGVNPAINPNEVYIFFGVLEKGAPIVLSCNKGITSQCTFQPPLPDLGQGFTLQFDVQDPATNFSAFPLRGRITMDRLGIPVQLNNATPAP